MDTKEQGGEQDLTLDDIAGKKPETEGNKKDQKPSKPDKNDEKIDRENERLRAKAYENEQRIKSLEAQLEAAKAEKRKPGITAIDEDGNERRKRPNSFGLSDKILPPFIKGRIAIYRIVNAEAINPATGLPVEPVDVVIPGKFTINDPFERDPLRRRKKIRNIISTEEKIADQGFSVEEDTAEITFRKGWKHVSIQDEYALHTLLELHPNNRNNKFRDRTQPVLFERVDIQVQSKSSQAAQANLSLDAGNEVRTLDVETLRGYSASVPEVFGAGNRPLIELRSDMMKWAMANPIAYFKLTNNTKAAIKINMMDAIDLGLVQYRQDKKGWVFIETEEVISNHTAAQDPMDVLVKYLASEDKDAKEWYKVVMERLGYWDNAA